MVLQFIEVFPGFFMQFICNNLENFIKIIISENCSFQQSTCFSYTLLVSHKHSGHKDNNRRTKEIHKQHGP